MALTYNNVDPTTINYKGTDITVVKYGNTAAWGKHYTLSISAGSNTSITVNRTSSPNQHASTGNIPNGSTIYYGDVLTISYSVSSGYNINTHTVNGTTFTSGTSYTVTGAISVITTAVASASWHTIWSGTSTRSFTYSYIDAKDGLVEAEGTFTSPTTLTTGRTTRLSGYFTYSSSTKYNFSNKQIRFIISYETNYDDESTFGVDSYDSSYFRFGYFCGEGQEVKNITLTKIEQYY